MDNTSIDLYTTDYISYSQAKRTLSEKGLEHLIPRLEIIKNKKEKEIKEKQLKKCLK